MLWEAPETLRHIQSHSVIKTRCRRGNHEASQHGAELTFAESIMVDVALTPDNIRTKAVLSKVHCIADTIQVRDNFNVGKLHVCHKINLCCGGGAFFI